ncbi:MAG: HAMP domain-containing sensor histidine kinase [Gammaproteobacteria bacterium]
MLHDFLSTHRGVLIEQCRAKVVVRRGPRATGGELAHGIPLFLDQLIRTLRVEQTSTPLESRKISGAADGGTSTASEIGATAARHGLELLQDGFTVDQVVHDYGDLCQSITEMALERGVTVQTVEFQTLNRCLDNAIADAVTQFADGREAFIIDREVQSLNERTGVLGHELRNLVHVAKHAFSAIKLGKVGPNGSTSAALERSLDGISALIERALIDVRTTARMPARTQPVLLADFIGEVQIAASMGAHARQCQLSVSVVDPTLTVDIDPDSLMSAVGNLLQNAFKFTHPHSTVALDAYADADRVRIDVKDQCGGLPSGLQEIMFLPFTQGSTDKTGLGLGLSIARGIIEAHNGILSVRDVPGIGCVFTIDLPRLAMPLLAVASHESIQ